MRSVMLAAVHYGELSESPAQEVVTQLLLEGLVQDFVEVTEQPNISEGPEVSDLVAWRRNQTRLERIWREYLQQGSRLRDVAASVNERVFHLKLVMSSDFRRSQWRSRQIENLVTAKHIRAWESFLASPASVLMVVESDAAMAPSTITRMTSTLTNVPEDQQAYINLAGGLQRSEIAIEPLVVGEAHGMVVFSRPVTNTSCAYVINRKLASALLEFLAKDPSSRALGIDWLFNAFFLDQASAKQFIHCLHAEPPVLKHGSLTGLTSSWHPDR